MDDSTRRLGVLLVGLLTWPAFGVAKGQGSAPEPPLVNWIAPATYTPSATQSRIRALTDISNPVPFIPTAPCRQYNSNTPPTPLLQGVNRTVSLTSGACGIPTSAVAVSVNITVFNITGATGNGVFKVDAVTPPVVAWINYPPTETQRGNAGTVALNGSGQIIVQVAQGAGQVDFIVDTNGYYSPTPAILSNPFIVQNNSNLYTIAAINNNSSCGGPCGIFGFVNHGNAIEGISTNGGDGVFGQSVNASGVGVHGYVDVSVASSKAVWGEHKATTGSGIGVYGSHAGTGFGVYGLSLGTTGGGAIGVLGQANSNSDFGAGVLGQEFATSGQVFGVRGGISSNSANAAGVYGSTSNVASNAGRFDENGISTYLGAQISGIDYGVATTARILGGSLVISGAPKSFAAPHPENPALEIRYASVEAPTVDVYFRGTADLVNGYAHIEIPDHFRFTAREGTYMTTLTSVGRPGSLGVESEGPDGILVRGSGNGRFHYVVYAERAEIEGFQPVQRNETFTHEMLRRGLLKGLPAATKALLVKNKTINADGSYNLETARAQGWSIPTQETAASPNPGADAPASQQ